MKVIDLFSGCGGMSLGFQNAGFNIVAAYENWKPALDTYKTNFSHPAYELDLASEEAKEIIKSHEPDLIIGGPPCQDFSIAGKRDCFGDRANLTNSFADIIDYVRPDIFVMENVYNIEKSRILPIVLDKFINASYGLTAVVLDSSFLGVPQARKRYFLVGKKGETHDFLQAGLLSKHSATRMTVRDYFGNELDTDFYYMHPRSYKRRAIFSVDEPSSTIRGVNRPIPDTYKMHPADKSHPGNARALTSEERASIQTFPKGFKFSGTKTSVEQQIGNAVPVKMAEHVATVVKEYLTQNAEEN
jgi:DNA (cytosine-5)-methyltransferase 1